VHQFLVAIADGTPRDEALSAIEIPEHRAWCERIDTSRIPRGAESEVVFAYNWREGTARRTRVDSSRDYESNDHEIPGTADLVLWSHNDLDGPVVFDWKSNAYGFDPLFAKPQLEFYALCAARIANADSVWCAIRVIDEQGAIVDGGTWQLQWEDLARVAASVQRAALRVADARALAATGATVPVAEGPACRWCNAWSFCPAKREGVRWVLDTIDESKPVDDGQLIEAWLRAREAVKLEESLKQRVKQRLQDKGNVLLPDGRAVRLDGRNALVVK
jgi:hypothetical protein